MSTDNSFSAGGYISSAATVILSTKCPQSTVFFGEDLAGEERKREVRL
jgi:hypothetical protein